MLTGAIGTRQSDSYVGMSIRRQQEDKKKKQYQINICTNSATQPQYVDCVVLEDEKNDYV